MSSRPSGSNLPPPRQRPTARPRRLSGWITARFAPCATRARPVASSRARRRTGAARRGRPRPGRLRRGRRRAGATPATARRLHRRIPCRLARSATTGVPSVNRPAGEPAAASARAAAPATGISWPSPSISQTAGRCRRRIRRCRLRQPLRAAVSRASRRSCPRRPFRRASSHRVARPPARAGR